MSFPLEIELLSLSFSDTGSLGPKVRRQWKLWQALRELLRIGHASSRDNSVVADHFASLAMVRREPLTSFVTRRPSRARVDAVVPSLHDIGPLCAVEEREGGACYASVTRELVSASRRFSERWRFKASLSLDVRTPCPSRNCGHPFARKQVKMPRDLCTSVS